MTLAGAMLGITRSGYEMFGEAIREIAVLGLVFIPLDYFKDRGGMSLEKVEELLRWCFFIFLVGVASQWVSDRVKWAEKIWEDDRVI
jgi:hypothetical protein